VTTVPWQRFKGFMGRRLSRTDYLGLHLTLGLCFTLLLTLAYVWVAREVFTHQDLNSFDHRFGKEMAEHRANAPVLLWTMWLLTWLGSFQLMLVLVPLIGFVLWRHKRGLAIVWLFAALGGGLINQVLKLAHDRDRPDFKSEMVHESNKSFPSGHSTGAVCAYGVLAYFAWLRWPEWWRRFAVTLAAILLSAVIGFTRIYLGAHYCSDVLAGFCIGAAWLSICIEK